MTARYERDLTGSWDRPMIDPSSRGAAGVLSTNGPLAHNARLARHGFRPHYQNTIPANKPVRVFLRLEVAMPNDTRKPNDPDRDDAEVN